MSFSKNIQTKIQSIDKADLVGIALTGSYARGEAKTYSDIDLLCFAKNLKKPTEICMIDGKYLTISYCLVDEVATYFTEPKLISEFLYGLQNLKPIWEVNQFLTQLKTNANAFVWTPKIQQAANEYACQELIGWIEEVHKGIQGILSKDVGRQLNAIFGLSYGLANVLLVQKGVLLKSDNTFYEQLLETLEDTPAMVNLFEQVFGLKGILSLENRVRAGLLLFQDVIKHLAPIFDESTRKMLMETNRYIDEI